MDIEATPSPLFFLSHLPLPGFESLFGPLFLRTPQDPCLMQARRTYHCSFTMLLPPCDLQLLLWFCSKDCSTSVTKSHRACFAFDFVYFHLFGQLAGLLLFRDSTRNAHLMTQMDPVCLNMGSA